MFLTRMALDINRPDTQTLIVSPALLRLTVRLMFAGGNLQPLYRLDMIGARTWLVLLSHLRPEMLAAHVHYGYSGVFPSWETFDYDESLQTVQTGSLLNFDLAACPFELSGSEALPPRSGAEAWLAEQGAENGFALLEAGLSDYAPLETEDSRFAAGRWKGRLRVTEAERFLTTLQTGIGLHRADYGEGLMTVSFGRSVWD